MKTRIYSWGRRNDDTKILVTLDFDVANKQIHGHVLQADEVTQEFENLLANTWRHGGEVVIPDIAETFTLPLTITDPILPDGITIESEDLLRQAHSEWNYLAMSQELFDLYHQEVEDFNEKLQNSSEYDQTIWDSVRAFWDKVNEQIRDRTLWHEHANTIRKDTDALFDQMKVLRKKMDEEFREKSESAKNEFGELLHEIEQKIEGGLSLQPLFNELRQLQKRLKDTNMTRAHKNKVWERIDKNFKTIKSKRFGDNADNVDQSRKSRHEQRLDSLMNTIHRMQNSIKRDENDLQFQHERIDTTSGQLEQQIRVAKLKMIEERLNVKRNKLSELLESKSDLENKIEADKIRKEKRAEEEKHKEEIRQRQEEIAKRLHDEAQAASATAQEELDKLLTAAEAINESRHRRTSSREDAQSVNVSDSTPQEASDAQSSQQDPSEDETTIMEQLADKITDSFEDIVDTAKAVAIVVSDQIQESINQINTDLTSSEEE